MIALDRLIQGMPEAAQIMRNTNCEPTVMRMHQDVTDLAFELMARDKDKLVAQAITAFFPTEVCWIEWPMAPAHETHPGGTYSVMFAGTPDVRTGNLIFYAWEHGSPFPMSALSVKVDLENGVMDPDFSMSKNIGDPIQATNAWHSMLKPLVLAMLALVNEPKITKTKPAKLERLNKKRQAAGKYTFHPHHTVRLNIDKKIIHVQQGSGGDGATRCLHLVRAHLRLWNGRYILVRPHWRGDPQVGIRKTSYEADRTGSKWAD